MFICKYVCMYVYIHIYVYIHAYIYIYTYYVIISYDIIGMCIMIMTMRIIVISSSSIVEIISRRRCARMSGTSPG